MVSCCAEATFLTGSPGNFITLQENKSKHKNKSSLVVWSAACIVEDILKVDAWMKNGDMLVLEGCSFPSISSFLSRATRCSYAREAHLETKFGVTNARYGILRCSSLRAKRKIYDAFLFHDEVDLLVLRLHHLASTVDKFILVEGSETFSGSAKNSTFERMKQDARIAPFLPKIIHVIAPPCSNVKNEWSREHHQRNFALTGIPPGASAQDIFMLSDVDELPRLEAIEKLVQAKEVEMVHFSSTLFYYDFHHLLEYHEHWLQPAAAPLSTMATRTPQQLRDARVFRSDNHSGECGMAHELLWRSPRDPAKDSVVLPCGIPPQGRLDRGDCGRCAERRGRARPRGRAHFIPAYLLGPSPGAEPSARAAAAARVGGTSLRVP